MLDDRRCGDEEGMRTLGTSTVEADLMRLRPGKCTTEISVSMTYAQVQRHIAECVVI